MWGRDIHSNRASSPLAPLGTPTPTHPRTHPPACLPAIAHPPTCLPPRTTCLPALCHSLCHFLLDIPWPPGYCLGVVNHRGSHASPYISHHCLHPLPLPHVHHAQYTDVPTSAYQGVPLAHRGVLDNSPPPVLIWYPYESTDHPYWIPQIPHRLPLRGLCPEEARKQEGRREKKRA